MGTPMTYISGNTGTYQSGTFNKGSIALNLNPSSLASGNNWYNGVDVTATQYLIYSDTYSQGQATVANSKPTAWTTPDLSDTSLLNLINTLPDRVGVLPFTSLPLALQWLNATNKYFLIKTNFENIVTSGLILNLDAGWYNSYSGTTTWFDIKGGYNGTLTNGPTFSGNSQGVIVFDGVDDYVSISNTSLLTFETNPFSIEFWIYPTHTTLTSYRTILSNYNNYNVDYTSYFYLGITSTPSNNTLTFLDSTGNFITGNGFVLKTNVWTHVMFTRNGYVINSYENGILQSSVSKSNNFSGVRTTKIGGGVSGVSTFEGNFSNLKIYNQSLSPEQVLQNYNAQKSRFGIYDIVQSGLTHSYDAANYLSYPRSGTTWFDMTSTANNGTLVNGPTFNTGATPSIQFDGSDDYINATNTKFIGSVPSTFEFWMTPSVVTNSSVGECFLQVGNATNNQMRLYFFRDAKFAVAYYSNDFTFNYTAVANTTYHAVFTENGSGAVQLYINGVLVSSGNLTPPNTQGGTYWIGQYSGSYRFNGKMFSHRAYNRVLSAQEVVQNYEAQRVIYGATGYTTSGLTLNLDAGNYASYPTTGTKWVDISGSYNNGTLTNGPVWSNSSGGTFTFDGVDDYVNVGVDKNCNQFTGDFAVCAWVNRSNLGGTWGNIIGDYYTNSTANALEWQLMVNNSNNLFVYNVTNGYVFAPISTGIAINTWMYVTLTRIGSTLKLYANTTEIASTTNTTTFGSSTGNLNIGIDGNNSSEPFTGKIANVMIYKNKGLTSAEIIQNYNALKGRFGL